jgi:2-ketocyclohexanecarboxyl-CoA hydrolase
MGCGRYSATQMLDWGLVNAVVPMSELDAEVKRWCDRLLAVSPTCHMLLKRPFRDVMHWTSMSDMVARYAPNYFKSGEQQEGAAAFLEKRKPDFSRWR